MYQVWEMSGQMSEFEAKDRYNISQILGVMNTWNMHYTIKRITVLIYERNHHMH